MALDEAGLWKVARATQMSVIVDADAYFRNARSAMLKARKRIMLVGWDFDARIKLVHAGHGPDEPQTVGKFIEWLVDRNPELEVYLLRWDVGALKTLIRGTNIVTLAKWMRHPRIHTKLDSVHPTGGSHHQKIVVIDDCIAFCGGIDMTGDRWDTRKHYDHDSCRIQPNGKPYKPWHDATTAVQGPAAAALGELCRDRWHRAGGIPIEAVDGQTECWPDKLAPDFRDIPIGIAQTRPEMPDCPEVREIEALFVAHIAAAKTTIYAESQYFASRKIAEAMAKRLKQPKGPEIVIINPETAHGWLEPLAMDTARARLFAALKRLDTHDRLRMYHPFTTGGRPIYVHAKIMIVDDRILRVGSANMNNRSLGLDTECDLAIDAKPADRPAVRAIRDGLIAEHLGMHHDRVSREIDERGSLIATIDALRGRGRTLRPYAIPNLSEVEAWLADNEILDPERPSEMFEATTKRGLFRRIAR